MLSRLHLQGSGVLYFDHEHAVADADTYLEVGAMLLELHARLVLLLHVFQLPFLEGPDVARADAFQERREHL